MLRHLELPRKERAPNVKADAGESGAARTADGKSDLKSSIMTILKSDAPVHDAGKTKMDELAEKRRALQSQRKKLTADLRNESRKRKRIQQRAQYLTDDDLVEAIAMRANRKNKADSAEASQKKSSSGAA